MKVIILAGGHAQRLWPLTEHYPKPLLRIAGKPVLYHLLENISHIPDIQSVTIAIDENKKNYFIRDIENLNLAMNPRPCISAHALYANGKIKGPIKKISEIFAGMKSSELQDDFLILGGDNVFGFSLSQFFNFFRQAGKNCNAIQCVQDTDDLSQFGIPSLDDSGRMTDFVEKPASTCLRMISTACYAFEGSYLKMVDDFLADDEDDRLGEFIGWMLKKTEMVGYQFQDSWFDVGSREGLLDANRFLLNWKEANRRVPKMIQGRTKINPPVHIEESATIIDSTIGPNVYIAKNARIENAKIKNSIIYEDCTVRNSLMDRSIVGNNCIIDGNISSAVFGPRSNFLGESIRK
jgi:glucose-1-phosphate thymidylyltransferase